MTNWQVDMLTCWHVDMLTIDKLTIDKLTSCHVDKLVLFGFFSFSICSLSTFLPITLTHWLKSREPGDSEKSDESCVTDKADETYWAGVVCVFSPLTIEWFIWSRSHCRIDRVSFRNATLLLCKILSHQLEISQGKKTFWKFLLELRLKNYFQHYFVIIPNNYK